MSPMVGFITQKEAKLASRPSPRDLDARLSRTEQRIVDAARTCFEASGIGKTRLEDIAISAGVSRQTIYKYFTGKQDIVDQIGFLEMVKINGILRTTLNSAEGFADRLTNAIVLSVEISIENTYISRAIPAGNNSRVRIVLDALLPPGSALEVALKGIDANDPWQTVARQSNKALDENWQELLHESVAVNESAVQIRLTLRGNSSARPSVRNLRVMIV